MLEYDSEASARRLTFETDTLFAAARLRPVHVPDPVAAHQRRPRAGAATMPRIGFSLSTSAMRVAQTGTPLTKLWVPSIGSITHRRGPWPVVSYSSPSTASLGRWRLRMPRMRSSASRSASLTSVRSGLDSTTRSTARNRDMVIFSAASASVCANRRSSS
jgi:hypothetical protein